MQLPPHLIASFKEVFFKDLGYEITDEQANEYGLGDLDLVMALAGHPAAIRDSQKEFESSSVSKKRAAKTDQPRR